MFRNIFSVLIGILISFIEILFSIKYIKKGFINIQSISIIDLKSIFYYAPDKFFIILFIFYIFSTFLGCILTAFFVKKAKKAYAMLTGFILFIFSFIHIFIYTFPLWFRFSILTIFFPFSYLSGEFVEFLQKKKWIK
ncbi:hypothetical protein [Blattabacterium cuenoti]|uniref:hypothetical protein n=1 Tax=Blattabacterium cuenoti TaxID=1653831 RepID=UPI00163BCE7B|nr:hypothetical protein [Blattabacterium cuenoti]